MPIRLLIAADCPAIHETVTELLNTADIEVVAAARNGNEAVRLALTCHPDVVILDQAMRELSGIAAARAIRAQLHDVHLILLTSSGTEREVALAFAAGIRAFVLKKDAAADLIRAIHDVVRGLPFLSAGIARLLFEPYLPNGRTPL
jgi:DNA-binding NarL/FixJ family response regulator